jgi:type III secretory pathway component EscR
MSVMALSTTIVSVAATVALVRNTSGVRNAPPSATMKIASG